MCRVNLVLQLWLKILTANQIAAFSNRHYIWKESTRARPAAPPIQQTAGPQITNTSGALQGVIQRKKAASKTTTPSWVWPGAPRAQLGCMILWSSISLKEFHQYQFFSHLAHCCRTLALWKVQKNLSVHLE